MNKCQKPTPKTKNKTKKNFHKWAPKCTYAFNVQGATDVLQCTHRGNECQITFLGANIVICNPQTCPELKKDPCAKVPIIQFECAECGGFRFLRLEGESCYLMENSENPHHAPKEELVKKDEVYICVRCGSTKRTTRLILKRKKHHGSERWGPIGKG